MAFSFLQTGSAQGGNPSVTGLDTTGADIIIVALASQSVGSPSVSDNKGNTYTSLDIADDGSARCNIFYCLNPSVGTGHNFTGSGSFSSMIVSAFSGAADSSVVDAQEENTGSGTTIASGSVSPSENNCLVVTAICANVGISSVDSGFTSSTIGGGSNFRCGFGYKIQTTAGTENPTWTLASSAAARTKSAVFKHQPFTVTVNDSSSASEGQAFNASTSQSDTASASVGSSAGLPSDTSDTATVADGHSFAFAMFAADTASVSEGRAFSGSARVADSATANEQQSRSGGSTTNDSSNVTESLSLAATSVAVDTATASEDVGDIEPTLAKTYILTEPLPYGT